MNFLLALLERARMFRRTLFAAGAGATAFALHRSFYGHAIRDMLCLPKSGDVVISKAFPYEVTVTDKSPPFEPKDTFLYVRAKQGDNPHASVSACFYGLDALQKIH